jgi:hypothetical protein
MEDHVTSVRRSCYFHLRNIGALVLNYYCETFNFRDLKLYCPCNNKVRRCLRRGFGGFPWGKPKISKWS